jgi:phospholipid N-methyltransferase
MLSKRYFFAFRFLIVSFIVFNTGSVFGNKEVVGTQIRAKTSWIKLFKHYISDSLFMTKEFFKDRRNVGAVTPSSPFVVREILKAVPKGNILEIGAGCGTISIPMVEGLHSLYPEEKNFRVDIIEANKIFYERLALRVSKLTNVYLYNMFFDADWAPIGDQNISYDLIIATIPWTQIDASMRKVLLQKIYDLLAPGGTFIYISLILADTKEEIAKCFNGNKSLAKDDLEKYFITKTVFKTLNIPSVFVHFGKKRVNLL